VRFLSLVDYRQFGPRFIDMFDYGRVIKEAFQHINILTF